MDLSLRINLLKEGAQIDGATAQNLFRVIDCLKRDFEIELSEENGGMLITHLAVALERIKKNALVEPVDAIIFEEIQSNAYFEKANSLLDAMEKEIHVTIPESEKSFILMHLVTLLNLSI